MQQILYRLFDHQSLSRNEANEIMTKIASGAYNDAQISAFITVFLMRSIELEEIIGFREALLSMALKIDLSAYETIDIVGTGGDGKNTFNISTAACFVVAGAGYKVAKHGNYGATSVSGSSNVLEFFGAKFSNQELQIKKSLELTGFTYLHAPFFNPAMKNVVPVRKNLAVRTFFNVLGPLINPTQPKFQLLGVYDLKMMRLYNYIYQNLGVRFSIVHSLDGYDEISLTKSCKIVNNTGEQVYTPTQLGYQKISQQALWGGNSVADAASIFMNVLDNQASEEQQAAVVINAAIAIQTLRPKKSLEECKQEALAAIQNGSAKKTFKEFINIFS